MPLICLEYKNDYVVVGESAFIKLREVKMTVQRMKAKLYLEDKKNSSPNANVVSAKLDVTRLDKIERLMEGDKNISNDKNYFLEYFDNFTTIIPAWGLATNHEINSPKKKRKLNEEVVNIFWNQFRPLQIGRVMVIRKQNSGLCYLHAPVVYEHYLIAIATDCSNCGIINIGKYEDYLLTGDDLTNFLFQDKGGNSLETLDKICNLTDDDRVSFRIPDKKRYASHYAEVCEEILQNVSLKSALVSTFKVYDDRIGGRGDTSSNFLVNICHIVTQRLHASSTCLDMCAMHYMQKRVQMQLRPVMKNRHSTKFELFFSMLSYEKR